MQKGKQLEREVKEYLIKNETFFHKFNDSFSARGMVTPVPSDFLILSKKGPSILLECKETKKSHLPLSSFRPSQFKAMRQSLVVDSCNYYVIIKYNEFYYLVGADDILQILDNNRKSIDLEKEDLVAIPTISNVMYVMLDDNRNI